MKKIIFKILGISIGIILILFLAWFVFLAFYPQLFMGYDTDYDKFDERIRNEIVQRIDNYVEQNKRLPKSLSEIGFDSDFY